MMIRRVVSRLPMLVTDRDELVASICARLKAALRGQGAAGMAGQGVGVRDVLGKECGHRYRFFVCLMGFAGSYWPRY